MKIFHRKPAKASSEDNSISHRLGILGTIVALGASVVGGAWAFFQFAYPNWIEPRLSPAMVQATTETKYVTKNSCCHLYEITTKLTNSGKREVVLLGSHQVIAVRKLDEKIIPDDKITENSKREFINSRPITFDTKHIEGQSTDYFYGKPLPPFLFISAGNLIAPGSRIPPGGTHINKSIAAVPIKYLIASIRANTLISHFSMDNLTLRWLVEPETLNITMMPWSRDDENELNRLVRCAKEEDRAGRIRCHEEIMAKAQKKYQELRDVDQFSYLQSYSQDIILHPSVKSND